VERNNEKEFLQKEIILFPCPYSDFSQTKIRPAIIVSNNNYNKTHSDILIAPITTKRTHQFGILLNEENIIEGRIVQESEIRVDKIMPISKTTIISQVALVEEKILLQIIEKLIKLLKEN
jgi:mRNA interferase MazF